jgi:tRNA(Ile)-lysidine synthase TilS/MesJ
MNCALTMIRPLCYIAENDIREFIAEQGYRPVVCRCPWGDVGFRSKARFIAEEVRMNLFRAQCNIAERFREHVQPDDETQPPADIEDVQVTVASSK